MIFVHAATAQCPLACNGLTHVSLGVNGTSLVTPQNILNNPPMNCLPDYQVVLIDANGNMLPQPIVNCQHVNQTLTVKVYHTPSNNFCWGNLLVEDKLAPSVQCQNDTISCSTLTDTSGYGKVKAIDNCQATKILVKEFDTTLVCNASNPFIKKITRIWRAKDQSGNLSDSCTQTIHVTKNGLDNIFFPPHWIGVNAFSCEQANPDPSITGVPLMQNKPLAPVCKILVSYADSILPICGKARLIERLWTAYDCCTDQKVIYKQQIQMLDTTPPLIDCPKLLTVSVNETNCTATVLLPPADVIDNCSTNLTAIITSSLGTGPGPYTNVPIGSYLIKYTATDSCGNTKTCNTILQVKDVVTPTVVCPSDITVLLDATSHAKLSADSIPSFASDNCCLYDFEVKKMADADSTYTECLNFDCGDTDSSFMVQVRVWDCYWNKNYCMVNIHVRDTIPPMITCPVNITVNCKNEDISPAITGFPIVVDSCSSLISASYSDIDTLLNICDLGIVYRIWTGEDASGNISQCIQNIEIKDITPPTIIWPSDVSLDCIIPFDSVIMAGIPQFQVDCESFAVAHKDSIVIQPGCDIVIRQWKANNICTGLDTIYNQTIHLLDTIQPSIDCPDDVTIYADLDCVGALVIDPATIQDECAHYLISSNNSPSANSPDKLNISGFYKPGIHLITIHTQDACNEAMCSVQITVLDTISPILQCKDNVIINLDGDCIQTINPLNFIEVASDNCGTPILSANPDSVTLLNCGPFLFTITATDSSNNATSCLIHAIVVDSSLVCCGQGTQPGTVSTGNLNHLERSQLSIQPNPFRNQTELCIQGIPGDEYQLQITSVDGVSIWQDQFKLKHQKECLQLDDRVIPLPGMYLLQLKDKSGFISRMITKF